LFADDINILWLYAVVSIFPFTTDSLCLLIFCCHQHFMTFCLRQHIYVNAMQPLFVDDSLSADIG